jgi:hypothetical protein
MKKVLAVFAAITLLAFAAPMVSAQTPNVQMFFDGGYGSQTYTCSVGQFGQGYVVAKNFNMFLVGIEYAIDYPAGITWIGETYASDLQIGNTKLADGGISQVFSLPQNGFFPILLATVTFRCDACNPDTPLAVVPNPVSGYLRATRYPDNAFVYGIGMTSIFCPTNVPVENTTWGGVKALYDE